VRGEARRGGQEEGERGGAAVGGGSACMTAAPWAMTLVWW